ncbi:MAG: hypothetical protein ACTSYA_02970 [Candidatus Kariarchaeaceae archaeon]
MKFFRRDKKPIPEEDPSESIKQLVKIVAGYVGYSSLDNRKLTDSSLRGYISDNLQKLVDKSAELQGSLIQNQILAAWSTSGKVNSLIKEIIKTLQNESEDHPYPRSYGFTTFFVTKKLEGISIDILYIIELDVVKNLEAIDIIMDAILQRLQTMDLVEIEGDVTTLYANVESVKKTMHERAELIASFEKLDLT